MIRKLRFVHGFGGEVGPTEVLGKGEAAVDSDTGAMKVGDGSTAYSDLPAQLPTTIDGGTP